MFDFTNVSPEVDTKDASSISFQTLIGGTGKVKHPDKGWQDAKTLEVVTLGNHRVLDIAKYLASIYHHPTGATLIPEMTPQYGQWNEAYIQTLDRQVQFYVSTSPTSGISDKFTITPLFGDLGALEEQLGVGHPSQQF